MNPYRYSKLDAGQHGPNNESETLLGEEHQDQGPPQQLDHREFYTRAIVAACIVIIVPTMTGLIWWLNS